MTFSEQLSSYRKRYKFTQEELAEKCDVTRQAVAKWENGESIPDVYKISQIAELFDISIEKLVWGEDKDESQVKIAKRIYMLFVECVESWRSYLIKGQMTAYYDNEPLTRLRTEIKKARMNFSQKIIDELMGLTEDVGRDVFYIRDKKEYQEYYKDCCSSDYKKRMEIYCSEILPKKYILIEELLKDYLKLP